MSHLAISIDWFGPYETIDELKEVRDDYGEGVYLACGCVGAERKSRIQYIGYGESVAARAGRDHSKLNMIVNKKQIWLGEISSAGKPGRRVQGRGSSTANMAEGVLIYALRPPLNKQRKYRSPAIEVTVFNRWWQTDYETAYLENPVDDWPDIIDYREGFPVRLGWADWAEIK